MNAPPRFESFMLYDGEKKIEVKKEVNVPGKTAKKPVYLTHCFN